MEWIEWIFIKTAYQDMNGVTEHQVKAPKPRLGGMLKFTYTEGNGTLNFAQHFIKDDLQPLTGNQLLPGKTITDPIKYLINVLNVTEKEGYLLKLVGVWWDFHLQRVFSHLSSFIKDSKGCHKLRSDDVCNSN